MTENIVHLVLARTPTRRPGPRASRCFIVPKFLLDDDGALGRAQRRQVRVASSTRWASTPAPPA